MAFAAPTLSDILLSSDKITPDIIRSVSEEDGDPPKQICQRLVDMGFISEEDLLKTLGHYYGIPYISLKNYSGKTFFIESLSEKFMKQARIVPLELKETTLSVAINNPFDMSILEAIRLSAGFNLELHLAKENEILDTIDRLFSTETTSMDRIIENIKDDKGQGSLDDESNVDHLKDLASEAPVIRLVNLIISRAIELQASDIHFEPFEGNFKVRYRIDGILHDMESPPKSLQAAVISRIKIMSKLNIAERRLPQDGRIMLRVMGKEIDFRVSTLPTLFGESVVMRILDRESIILNLESLGFPEENLIIFEDLIARPYGIILVTGPTGSGKTTTLYGALNKINSPDKKIITVEDPVEYQLQGVNQIHVKPSIGLTFANCLRSILRQDPDVIMIGEIRDAETAEIAIHAALTGHLVFSTLHTNDAAGAVTRLLEMGMENYLLASSLLGVLAQRLVRVVCPKCQEEYVPDIGMLQEMEVSSGALSDIRVVRGNGCEWCANTGYKGRTGIYELLQIGDEVRQLILDRADSNSIKEKGRSLGMRTLREAGWVKVQKRVTTISEVLRVTQVEY
jgi:general secretion pathway protein E